MKKVILALLFCFLTLSCAEAAGLVWVEVTGTNVNIRDGAGLSGAVVGRANKPDGFIAQDWPFASADGNQWYRLIFSVDKKGELKDVREFTKTADFPYIAAQFVKPSPLTPEEQEQARKAQAVLASGKAPAKAEEIRVSTARDFLEVLGSDRVIILKAGGYDLSEWDPRAEFLSESLKDELGYPDENKMPKLSREVTWGEAYDGGEITLTGIRNLTIRGDKDGGTAITVDPRYAFILKFVNSSGIVIEDITAGHTEGGTCLGGVFAFESCSDVTIKKTRMYGCGTVGLELEGVRAMTVTDSEIYECTYSIMDIQNSRDVSFLRSVFRDNREFSLVKVEKSEEVSFDECTFTDNTGTMFYVKKSKNVLAVNTTFSGNSDPIIPMSEGVTFRDCSFYD